MVRSYAGFNTYCLLWVLTTVTHEDEPIGRDSSNYKLFQVKVLPFDPFGKVISIVKWFTAMEFSKFCHTEISH